MSPPVGGLDDLAVLAGIVLVLFGWILQLASPALLPTGRGADLTHHLLLTDYIERHWRLVHDPALAAVMGEMAHYTPGSHLLAALTGAWFGTNALRAFYPLLTVCATLTGGFVFLIARRLLPTQFALISVMLLLLPLHYFVGAFTHDGFLGDLSARGSRWAGNRQAAGGRGRSSGDGCAGSDRRMGGGNGPDGNDRASRLQ